MRTTRAEYRHGSAPRLGLVITNLGTPDAPEAPALRRYLRQFLSDPRVVEIPRPIWWLILNLFILPFRPSRSAAKYRSIWSAEGSPLKVHTARQATMLAGYLGARGLRGVEVVYAMRYGSPSIPAALDALCEKGCDRVIVVPLYPQYAASTTASTFDAVAAWSAQQRNLPGIDFVRNFHDHPRYIAALGAALLAHWEREGGRPDVLVMSFHGLPRYTLERGDPYHCECHKTARLLAEFLGLAPDAWRVSFQSRFGRTPWLTPYTVDSLADLGRERTGRVDVICPGFVADCLETLEEIAIEARETFVAAGGGKFTYVPCLNENDAWLHALAEIVTPHITALSRPAVSAAEQDAARHRALALGANQ
ncbi:MAG: ferrochelatase [Burkholderiales bacterium]